MIFNGFSSRNSQLLVKAFTAFTTYVRPLLESNSFIWSPNDVYNITKIESVQRRFTKRIPSVSQLSYRDRLAFIGLDSLEYSRLITDIVMMYKTVHHLVDVDHDAPITVNSSETHF